MPEKNQHLRKATPDKVLDGLKDKVIQTSLTKDKEEELRKALEDKGPLSLFYC
jgi:uncharacterized membrane protein